MNELINKLASTKINHIRWHESFTRLYTYISLSQPNDVICLVGPSRSGKSALIEEITLKLTNSLEHNNHKSILKLVATNCSTNGQFSTKAFTISALSKFQNPFFQANPNIDFEQQTKIINRIARTPETTLHYALQAAIKHHNVRFLIVDEAHHVLYSTSTKKNAGAILDSWKCLAQECGLVLILVGSYPLLSLVLESPHLLGRSSLVHFPRYLKNKDDIPSFKKIISSYQDLLNIKEDLLINNAEYMYENSLGCIGLLSKWLTTSLQECIANNQEFSIEILDRTKKSPSELSRLEEEITYGEKIIKKSELLLAPKNSKKVDKKNAFAVKPKRFKKSDRLKKEND